MKIYLTLLVNSISFNWEPGSDEEDALTILESAGDTIEAPEWQDVTDLFRNEPAAYVRASSPQIMASFQIIPPLNISLTIQSISDACTSFMPSCLPSTGSTVVSFSGGIAEDVVFDLTAPLPDRVFLAEKNLIWLSMRDEEVLPATVTGPHELFVVRCGSGSELYFKHKT